jgi:hypothetical protein
VSVVLVSIAVAAIDLAARKPGDVLARALAARPPSGTAATDEFTTADGQPAVRVSRTVTRRLRGRAVTTGQAQALVVFPGAGALGVVSAVCPDPADLDRAGSLVMRIAARMTVTAAPAAA